MYNEKEKILCSKHFHVLTQFHLKDLINKFPYLIVICKTGTHTFPV